MSEATSHRYWQQKPRSLSKSPMGWEATRNGGQNNSAYLPRVTSSMLGRPSAISAEYQGSRNEHVVSIANLIERQAWEQRVGISDDFDPERRGYTISRDYDENRLDNPSSLVQKKNPVDHHHRHNHQHHHHRRGGERSSRSSSRSSSQNSYRRNRRRRRDRSLSSSRHRSSSGRYYEEATSSHRSSRSDSEYHKRRKNSHLEYDRDTSKQHYNYGQEEGERKRSHYDRQQSERKNHLSDDDADDEVRRTTGIRHANDEDRKYRPSDPEKESWHDETNNTSNWRHEQGRYPPQQAARPISYRECDQYDEHYPAKQDRHYERSTQSDHQRKGVERHYSDKSDRSYEWTSQPDLKRKAPSSSNGEAWRPGSRGGHQVFGRGYDDIHPRSSTNDNRGGENSESQWELVKGGRSRKSRSNSSPRGAPGGVDGTFGGERDCLPSVSFIPRTELNGNFQVFMLILVGVPGSGKSHFAMSLEKAMPWKYQRINQDTLGSRRVCEDMARRALEEGKCPIIDRCNFSVAQRKYFLDIAAADFNLTPVECVVFNFPLDECVRRCENRTNHETVQPAEAREVVERMALQFCPPLPNRINVEEFKAIKQVTDLNMFNDAVLEYLNKL